MFATKQQVLDAFHFRCATRYYDPERKISKEDFDYILELGRLSPSSVGSEPWQFLVVQNPELRQALKPVSWGMATQLDDASHVVVILANMMTGAALIGIDSCPIEGFNYAEVNRILAQTGAYDAEKYAVSVAVTFGYRAKDIRPKSRKPLNEIVHWIE